MAFLSAMDGEPEERQQKDESFLFDKNGAADESRFEGLELNGSIAINSADFGESKLLTTERRMLYNAEIQREKVKLSNGSWL